jgi:serine O-acetyltransferase
MELKGLSRDGLRDYVADQLDHFFPDKATGIREAIGRDLEEALARLGKCIDAAKMWKPGEFDYLQTSQYAMFLYFIANTIWRNRQNERLCTKLFYLNKALNSIDCFYKISMPEIWFVGHTVGIVFADASYGNYFVAYQNSTVGKNHGAAPKLGEGVVLYPNSAIVGNCTIGPRTFLAQGQSIIDQDTPGDCTVFSKEGKLLFRKPSRNLLEDFFRL